MYKTIKLRKGLDIKLVGEADKVKSAVDFADNFVVRPSDFHGVTPKLVVKVGDKVKAGSVIFFNKTKEEVKITSPVAGEITDIVRGEKRRILEVKIKATDLERRSIDLELVSVEGSNFVQKDRFSSSKPTRGGRADRNRNRKR